MKAGMMQDWDEWGARVPLTVLWIDDCQVCVFKIQAPVLAQLCTSRVRSQSALRAGCPSQDT